MYFVLLIGSNVLTFLMCFWVFNRGDDNRFGTGEQNARDRFIDSAFSRENATESSKSERGSRTSPHTAEARQFESGEPSAELLIGPDGNLSSKAIGKYGLNREQFIQLQSVISGHRGKMATWVATNVFQDEEASKSDPDGANVYRLPAMGGVERASMLKDLSEQVQSTTSKEVAAQLVADLAKGGAFGFMGKYDVVFRFNHAKGRMTDPTTGLAVGDEMIMEGEGVVNYSYSDPDSGRVIMSHKGASLEDVSGEFGDIFSAR